MANKAHGERGDRENQTKAGKRCTKHSFVKKQTRFWHKNALVRRRTTTPRHKSHCKGRSRRRSEPVFAGGKSRSAKLAHNAPLRLAHEAIFAPKSVDFQPTTLRHPSTKKTVRKMGFTSKITSIAAEGTPNDQTQRLRLIPQNKRQPLRLGYSTYRGVRIIKPPRRLLLRFQVEERLAPTHRRRSTASAALLSPSLR